VHSDDKEAVAVGHSTTKADFAPELAQDTGRRRVRPAVRRLALHRSCEPFRESERRGYRFKNEEISHDALLSNDV